MVVLDSCQEHFDLILVFDQFSLLQTTIVQAQHKFWFCLINGEVLDRHTDVLTDKVLEIISNDYWLFVGNCMLFWGCKET